MSGNLSMIPYGIQTEESDYRLHISFGTKTAYFFPSASGKAAIAQNLGREFSASQPGVNYTTGKGRRVPWQQLSGCVEIVIPQQLLDATPIKKHDLPDVKGRAAVVVARALLLSGMVPVPITTHEITEKQIQIRGKDLIVTSQFSIEVKCDFFGGANGIALQTHECNPLRRH